MYSYIKSCFVCEHNYLIFIIKVDWNQQHVICMLMDTRWTSLGYLIITKTIHFKEKLQPLYVKSLLKLTSDSEVLTTLFGKY